MQIKVYGIIRQLPVQTISLSKLTDKDQTFLFHCVYCGQAVCQIQGKVDKVFPGLEPTNDVVVVYKCMQCKRTYNFQTHDYKYKDVTRVVLTNQDNIVNTFHCYICRTPLVQFKEDKVWELPEFKLKLVPFNFTCYKNDCGKKYSFVDIV